VTESLAFLHGEQLLVGFLLAGVLVLIAPILIYFWLWHSKLSELELALAYFVIVAVLCGLFAITSGDPTSIFAFTVMGLSFILTLPWSLMITIGSTLILSPDDANLGDRSYALLLALAAGVNAVILYFIAVKMRRIIE
jgi:hypothetical protein